jgi:uncharacterized membrane protein
MLNIFSAENFDSKKFSMATMAILSSLVLLGLMILNKKMNLGLDPKDLATVAAGIAAIAIGHNASQAYADAKTDGKTSGVAQTGAVALASMIAPAVVPAALPVIQAAEKVVELVDPSQPAPPQ